MIYAFDSYYQKGKVKTACVAFLDWENPKPLHSFSAFSTVESEYISGQFYKRELPGILQLIADDLNLEVGDTLIIDGYVYLDNEKSKGLGGYLYEALGREYPVIGIAKKHFKSLTENIRTVYRGVSKKPLYVTALGVNLDSVANGLEQMHGSYRIPDILKYVDQLSKGN